MSAALLITCSKTNSPTNQIRNVSVNLPFSLNDPIYSKLSYSGNWMYIDGQGVRGLILTNVGGVIYALERNCPYSSNDSCATVTVETGNTSIGCGKYDAKNKWVPCCNSQFLLDGTLQKGPSVYSLKKYYVSQDGSNVTVTN